MIVLGDIAVDQAVRPWWHAGPGFIATGRRGHRSHDGNAVSQAAAAKASALISGMLIPRGFVEAPSRMLRIFH